MKEKISDGITVKIPVELYSDRIFDFFEALLFIKIKIREGKNPTQEEYNKLIDAIAFAKEEPALLFFKSLASYKDETQEENIGLVYSKSLYELITKQKLKGLKYQSFEDYYNSDLGLFCYLFFNIFELSSCLSNLSNSTYSIIAFGNKYSLYHVFNSKNVDKLLKTKYFDRIHLIFNDFWKLAHQKDEIASFDLSRDFSDLAIEEVKNIGISFIPYTKNKRRIIKYLDFMLSEVTDITAYSRNILNGLICSFLNYIESEEEFEELYFKEINDSLKDRIIKQFPRNYKDYLVKYEIEKEINAKDDFGFSFNPWLSD